jgi:hypothetical protein
LRGCGKWKSKDLDGRSLSYFKMDENGSHGDVVYDGICMAARYLGLFLKLHQFCRDKKVLKV